MISKPEIEVSSSTAPKSKITFSDLFVIDDIQKLQDEFALATGVASIITTPHGVPLTKPSNFCRLCNEVIRNTEKGLRNCYKSDAIIGHPKSDGPTISECMSGGLWDAGAGITVEGEHIANWLIGQVRDETQTEEKMVAYAHEIGADKDTFLQAYREVPSMSKEHFNNISSMLYTLANQLSSVAYQNVKQANLIKQLNKKRNDLRQSQQELLATEHRLSIVVNNLPTALIYQVEIAPDGKRTFTYVSENVQELNQVSAESVLKDSNILYKQVHPDDLQDLSDAENLATKAMKMFRYETRFILPDGSQKWFQLISSPRKIAGGIVAWDGIELDITDRKEAEEEHTKLEGMLRQSQKIEAIGQLAGGVAHDLNNMLSPIIGYAELLLLNPDQSQKNKKAINNIIDAGFKARHLVQQLLAFGRKQTLDFKSVDINSIVLRFEELIRRTVREDIELVTDISPELSPVFADKGQLEQVLMNLVVNAQDAMVSGGKLLIETCDVVVHDTPQALEINVPPGKYVRLSVSDTGCGIPDDVKDMIFDPFFSTKGENGTGLGLATVYGIITQHNGTISVQSEPGSKTTISIYLPVSEITAEHVQKVKPDLAEMSGDETILLVEDNQQVLDMTKTVLEQRGYNVLTASNGEQGYCTIQEYKGVIHLLVTDIIMPNMNGKDLFMKATSILPELNVLYISGYSDEVISNGGMLEEGTNFIQKPFSISTLSIKIREILDLRD